MTGKQQRRDAIHKEIPVINPLRLIGSLEMWGTMNDDEVFPGGSRRAAHYSSKYSTTQQQGQGPKAASDALGEQEQEQEKSSRAAHYSSKYSTTQQGQGPKASDALGEQEQEQEKSSSSSDDDLEEQERRRRIMKEVHGNIMEMLHKIQIHLEELSPEWRTFGQQFEEIENWDDELHQLGFESAKILQDFKTELTAWSALFKSVATKVRICKRVGTSLLFLGVPIAIVVLICCK